MPELKEAVLMDGHEWIRAAVVARMESLLIAELELLRKIAQATWARRDEYARKSWARGPGAVQHIPDEIDGWLEDWFPLREGNAHAFQRLAADSSPFDPELELLNRLGRIFPDWMRKLVAESWVNMAHEYVDHPDTVCSVRGSKPGQAGFSQGGQSALGFLNQSRRVRGLPRIAAVIEKSEKPGQQWDVRFELWAGPGDPSVGRVG